MLTSGGDSVAAHLHYRPKAKAKRDEAAIPFHCEVRADGKPAFISLFGPEDETKFRVALLKALSADRFQPAMPGVKAVPVLLGGTALFMFRRNQPIIAISLSTADKGKDSIAESPPGVGYRPLLAKAFQGAKFSPAFSNGKLVAGQFDMIANYDKMQNPNWPPADTHIKRDFTNW
jgi:hypothetical protein